MTDLDPQDPAPRALHILSLGAGVQSTTMALMAAHRELTPMPDAAIFADTGWEPKAVYDHLDWLCSPNVLPFPVRRVSDGNIREGIVGATNGKRWASIPAFAGSGMIRRQCTKEYKLVPLRREQRRMLGIAGKRSPKSPVMTVWIGISTDEIMRAKPPREGWLEHKFPLIDLGMSRGGCLAWLARHDYPRPPKSACIGCPFRSDKSWRSLTAEEFEDACEIDQAIRTGMRNMVDEVYLHRSLKPLDEVDLSTAEERGQFNMFNNECEGLCGV